MSQEKLGPEGGARHPRPRALTEEDVRSRVDGKSIELEARPETEFEVEMQSRPRDLTEDDVKSRLAGKLIDLEKREPLKARD